MPANNSWRISRMFGLAIDSNTQYLKLINKNIIRRTYKIQQAVSLSWSKFIPTAWEQLQIRFDGFYREAAKEQKEWVGGGREE